MKNLKLLIILFVCTLFVGCKNKEVYEVFTLNENGIYENEKIFEHFVENTKNKLSSNLVLLEIIEDKNQILYNISYYDKCFNVDSYLNGDLILSSSYLYLVEIHNDKFIYFFLTNKEKFNENDLENYLKGNFFDDLELYKKSFY